MFIEKLLYYYSLGRYTLVTTLINILVGICLFLITYYFIQINKISFKDLYLGSLSYLLLGIALRFFADLFVISFPYRLFLITPFIYIEMYLLALLLYLIVKKREMNISFWYYFPLCLGFVIISLEAVYAHTFRIFYVLMILVPIYFLYLILKKRYSVYELYLPILFQTYDALTTFVSTTFLGFYEEHVLGRNIISFAESHLFTIFGSGSWLFLVLKFLFSLLAVEILKREYPASYVRLLLWFMSFLGLATGTRNLLNILFI